MKKDYKLLALSVHSTKNSETFAETPENVNCILVHTAPKRVLFEPFWSEIGH